MPLDQGSGLRMHPPRLRRLRHNRHVHLDEAIDHCLAKPGAWADEPWGDGIVAKVGSKIFVFTSVGVGDGVIGVKCGAGREEADEWLDRYPADASPMPYLGRQGWNSLRLGGIIPDDELLDAIDASYAYVVSRLPKRERPTGAVD